MYPWLLVPYSSFVFLCSLCHPGDTPAKAPLGTPRSPFLTYVIPYPCSSHHFGPVHSQSHTRSGRGPGDCGKFQRHRCLEGSTHWYLGGGITKRGRFKKKFPLKKPPNKTREWILALRQCSLPDVNVGSSQDLQGICLFEEALLVTGSVSWGPITPYAIGWTFSRQPSIFFVAFDIGLPYICNQEPNRTRQDRFVGCSYL